MIPALETLIPKKLTRARVIIISAKAERTTAKLGVNDLKMKKTIRAIKMKEMMIAIRSWL